MPVYTVGRSNFAISTATDSLAIISSNYPLRILMCDIKGLNTSSSANEILLYRATTVGSSAVSGSITPSKVNTRSAAASFAVYSGFGSTTSTTAGDVLWRFVVNGNGGIDRLPAMPQQAVLQMPSSGYVLLRAATGGGSMTCNFSIEEVDG